ncbi:MAG: type II toxin-antitoxin system VapC family toxin [Chthoniobacterales bacterium]|nr:type II toxin-antitoxin system VapC family toxin [Chthoniobacterales bacterium]
MLDTNVVSETMRKRPSPVVLGWVAAQAGESLFLSAITVGELRRGALLLAEGKKRRALLHWIETGIKADFSGRILPVDTVVMERWAQLQVATGRTGKRMPVMDSLIAATALSHNLTLATRNMADFKAARVALVDPWQ